MKKIAFTGSVMLFVFAAFSQDSTIQMFGKVLDINNKPIESVRVALKGTDFKTITNGEGTYFFMLPAKKGIIIYSREGYKTRESQFTGTPQATDLMLFGEKGKKKTK